jgi:hypothetical protein
MPLIKFNAAVLHSRASRRKWLRTSNVNAVTGHLKLAGKSFARMSWTYSSGALVHRHHCIDCWKIPEDVTMIRLDVIFECPRRGGAVASSNSRTSSVSDRSNADPCDSSADFDRATQSPGWWRRSITSPRAPKLASSKCFPLNHWRRWNGKVWWADKQQDWQRNDDLQQ